MRTSSQKNKIGAQKSLRSFHFQMYIRRLIKNTPRWVRLKEKMSVKLEY